ncbi:MAG: tRNA-dihydrouridine synthase family protein [Candidatus Thermoplasmatota archaeon]|nr:tRNA-dihydrouridine synthase family protein [Candidatus Thermoplasmatota archaeon]MED5486289.1 tRNA-dihydrouridine synthase family protein [Candidatus Thermoplasmatota archaeon]|tara:strand:+ start:68 stop:1114 length:1047 start_codon:yes stop_codon:yes gene_type:complete
MSEQVPLFLAPMAGVTDVAYRLLARESGADFTSTEFTAASGLSRKDAKSWAKVETHPRESPFIPQIFGGIEDEMVETAQLLSKDADVIDLNFGCPAPKVTKTCAGAAMMGEPENLVRMVERCLENSEVPVSVKMRLGINQETLTVLEIAERCAELGVLRVCVHGRTLSQKYRGIADWDMIAKVVEVCEPHNTPVIANGDIVDADSAAKCLEVTGAQGLMIGRGAIGDPCIFGRIKSELGWEDFEAPWGDSNQAGQKHWAWNRYVELVDEIGGPYAARNMKQHAISFTKGLPGGRELRPHLHAIKDFRLIGEPLNIALEAFSQRRHNTLMVQEAIEAAATASEAGGWRR